MKSAWAVGLASGVLDGHSGPTCACENHLSSTLPFPPNLYKTLKREEEEEVK